MSIRLHSVDLSIPPGHTHISAWQDRMSLDRHFFYEIVKINTKTGGFCPLKVNTGWNFWSLLIKTDCAMLLNKVHCSCFKKIPRQRSSLWKWHHFQFCVPKDKSHGDIFPSQPVSQCRLSHFTKPLCLEIGKFTAAPVPKLEADHAPWLTYLHTQLAF